MSEEAVAAGATAGALLRQAREAAGLHVATLAANLKVPVRKLEALEEDRYDLLPDAVFVRALASSVCRTLKVDPQPVLARLPQTSQPRLVPDTEAINAPFRSPSDGPSPGMLSRVLRPVPLTVAVLLLGALVLILLPVLQRGYEAVASAAAEGAAPAAANGASVATTPADAPAAPAVEPVASGTPTAGIAPPAAGLAPDTAAAPAALPTPANPPLPTAAAVPAAAAPAASAPADTAAAAVPANAVVVFRTRGPSWIQVTDARGATVLQRLMGPGESAGVSGALPLAVTVGDAAQTDVQVRGKPFNLGPLARDNVARFEVK